MHNQIQIDRYDLRLKSQNIAKHTSNIPTYIKLPPKNR